MGRVLLNLYNNAFYAVAERRKVEGVGYEPTVSVVTKFIKAPSGVGANQVFITVSDNGGGIPQKIVGKNFSTILYHKTNRTRNWFGFEFELRYYKSTWWGHKSCYKRKRGNRNDYSITY